MNVWLCVRSHSHGNTQFTANPWFVSPKSHLCCAVEITLYHPASIICQFLDIWRLSTPDAVAGWAINQPHLQRAHLRWQKSNLQFRTDACKLTWFVQQEKVVRLEESTTLSSLWWTALYYLIVCHVRNIFVILFKNDSTLKDMLELDDFQSQKFLIHLLTIYI